LAPGERISAAGPVLITAELVLVSDTRAGSAKIRRAAFEYFDVTRAAAALQPPQLLMALPSSIVCVHSIAPPSEDRT
jgi:hypothetical protein